MRTTPAPAARFTVTAPGIWTDTAPSLLAAMRLASCHAGRDIEWMFGPGGSLTEAAGTYIITERTD